MTKERNNKLQREWYERNQRKNRIAFQDIMAKVNGSEKGLRLIKTGFRRVMKHKDATPQLIHSAARWLYLIEKGTKLPLESQLPIPSESLPHKALELDPESVVGEPTFTPDDGDPMMAAILNKLRV